MVFKLNFYFWSTFLNKITRLLFTTETGTKTFRKFRADANKIRHLESFDNIIYKSKNNDNDKDNCKTNRTRCGMLVASDLKELNWFLMALILEQGVSELLDFGGYVSVVFTNCFRCSQVDVKYVILDLSKHNCYVIYIKKVPMGLLCPVDLLQ